MGIEPIFPESESGVLPLHHSAIADAERFELGLQGSKSCVLTGYTMPRKSGKGRNRTSDAQGFNLPLYLTELPFPN